MFFKPRHIIFPANTACTLILEPQGPVTLGAEGEFSLKIQAFSGLRRYTAHKNGLQTDEAKFAFFADEHRLRAEDGALRLDIDLPQEDRWLCTILHRGEKLEQFEIYSLESDLFGLTPFKGDNHMHTCFSDGRESPEYRAANCCRRGYDYCVITDHSCYSASLIAKEMVDRLHIPYMAIPGEEIHAPGNKVHIISLGADSGVTEWYQDDPEGYDRAVRERMETIAEPMSEEDKWMAASSLEIFDRIHERGGAAIFCHPCWIAGGTLQHSEDVTNYLFDHKTFDVYELIAGGAFEEGTQMQISYYQNLPAMPIVGSSDTHQLVGGRLEPGNFTVAFAESYTPEAIREAVRAGVCVAGIDSKYWGDYRLVKYANFLQANYFPQHDKIQCALGDQLLFYVSAGCPENSPRIEKMQAMTSAAQLFDSLRWKA